MTKQDFILSVKKITNLKEFYALDDSGYPHYSAPGPKDSLYIHWTTGGVGGGSCWDTGDDDPHYSRDSEPEPAFEELDQILEVMCPKIGFLEYKALCREVVKSGEHHQNDYYGNYTDYATKYFKVEDLYDYLMSKGMIGSPDAILKKVL